MSAHEATTPTLAILGASGAFGSAMLKELTPLADKGAIKLVLLHRPSSKLRVPPCAEGRELDIGVSSDADVKAALDGVDVLIDASNNTPPDASRRLHTQLASAALRTYVPADYTLNFARTPADAPTRVLADLMRAGEEAAALLPTAVVHNGTFEHWLFRAEATGLDAATNTLKLYPGAEGHKLPVTSVAYLAAAVRQIVLDESGGRVRPADVAGKRFTVTEYAASGDEIGAAVQRRSGTKPKIVPLTDSEVEGAAALGFEDAIAAGISKAWGTTGFPDDGTITFAPRGVTRRTLDDTVRDALCLGA
jgi:hypothetical protein